MIGMNFDTTGLSAEAEKLVREIESQYGLKWRMNIDSAIDGAREGKDLSEVLESLAEANMQALADTIVLLVRYMDEG